MHVLKFSSTTCQPCKQLSKLLGEISTDIPTQEQDVYEDIELSKSHGIRSVPTLIALKDGTEVARLTGMSTKEKLQEWYNSLLTLKI